MRLAVAVEKELTKEQILERYLNVAYFGHRAYGDLRRRRGLLLQAAQGPDPGRGGQLAGLVKAPSAYDPAAHDQAAATERRNYVIDRMAELEYVTAEPRPSRRSSKPIKLQADQPAQRLRLGQRQAQRLGLLLRLFKNWWRQQPAFGANPQRAGGEPAPRRLHDRDHARPAASRQIAMERGPAKERVGSSVRPGRGGRSSRAPGRSRRWRSTGATRSTRAATARTPTRPSAATMPSNYPNTVAPLLGGGDMPGYQAGSTFKIFTHARRARRRPAAEHRVSTRRSGSSRSIAGSGAPAAAAAAGARATRAAR